MRNYYAYASFFFVEEGEKDDDNDVESDDGEKHKDTTPLWKYVTRLGGGREGGTTKFTCTHCTKTYTCSYTRVRKQMCGIMPCDQDKATGVKTYDKVSTKERNKYRMEEEVAQNNSKRSRVEYESSQSRRMFGSGSGSSFPHGSTSGSGSSSKI